MSGINTGVASDAMTLPSADSTANADIADVIGNKEDAVLADTVALGATTTKSAIALLKSIGQRVGADDANNAAATTLTAANRDGSILESLEDIRTELEVPSADATANANANDVIGNKTDAKIADTVAPAAMTTASLVAMIKAALARLGEDSANNEAATTLVAANRDGSILERLEHIEAGMAGTLFSVNVTVVSSSIPNNMQTGGAITGAASGALILEDILINTDGTGVVAPTNLEFSTDNASGRTGAGQPIFLEAVATLGANISASKKDATSHTLPMLLESGKKVFIHGDDAAGTGAGVATITLMFRRASDGATITGVNLP